MAVNHRSRIKAETEKNKTVLLSDDTSDWEHREAASIS